MTEPRTRYIHAAGLTLVHGDALEALKAYPADHFHTCVTSPPYWGLWDYGAEGQIGLENSIEEYLSKLTAIFEEVRRVLRPDGTAWINMGDAYASSGGHTSPGTTARCFNTKHGLAMHGPRRPPAGFKRKDLIGMPWRLAFSLQEAGWYLRKDIIWHKPNPMPESVTDRQTTAHEYLFLLAKSEKYYYNAQAIREPAVAGDHPRNVRGMNWEPPGQTKHTGLRAGQKKKPAGWDTGPGHHGREKRRDKQAGHGKRHAGFNERYRENPGDQETRNRRDVWTIATRPFNGAHFATFPVALIEPCILAGAPEGGTVLDPFAVAGTTLVTAYRLGRRAVGIEISGDYIKDIAIPRIKAETAQQRLL